MNKQRNNKNLKMLRRLKSEDILYSLISYEDIVFLRKSLNNQQVGLFCLCVEEQILNRLLPDFDLNRFINRIQSYEELTSQDFTIKNLSKIHTNIFTENLLKLLDENIELLTTMINFLYNGEVLKLYRRLSNILSPIIDIDIITIIKKLKKNSLNQTIVKKLEVRARLEFTYWAERFVSSWYKELSYVEDLCIKDVPIGPIAEYDLITKLMLEFPEKCYWEQENHDAA